MLASLVLVSGLVAGDEPGSRIPVVVSQATLREPVGRVHTRRGDGPWVVAREGEPLYPGDQVRAGRGSGATIRYWDGIEVHLESSTRVEVRDRAAPEREGLRVFLGEVLVEIRREGADATPATTSTTGAPEPAIPFRIRTPSSVAGAEGTRFRIRVDPEGRSDVAVLEGRVKLQDADETRAVTLGAEQRGSTRPGGLPGPARRLVLPWTSQAAELTRRERLDEPFFGELERFRSMRYLALVDLTRDALANPARVTRLSRGQGYDLVEASLGPRQGRARDTSERDRTGTVHTSMRDRSEAAVLGDLFRYRAVDDGRWGLAARLGASSLETGRIDLPQPGSPFAGARIERDSEVEGPHVSGLVQRAWRLPGVDLGLGLLLDRRRLDAVETFANPAAAAPFAGESLRSDVEDRSAAVSLGLSWDRGSRHDRGLVLRFQDRDASRTAASHLLAGTPVPLAGERFLDSRALGIDFLDRRIVDDRTTLSLRIFAEEARRDRRTPIFADPTRLRSDLAGRETGRLYGVGLGVMRRMAPADDLFVDLGWQRLDVSAIHDVPGLGPVLAEDRVETRSGVHLAWMRRFEKWDFRAALAFEHRSGRDGFLASAGATPLPNLVSDWVGSGTFTLGRVLKPGRRVELEFEEREPEAPERVFRLRWTWGH